MNLDDELYSYISNTTDRIEGVMCALISFIEDVGSELESYHYEAFNRFSNEIREMEITAAKEIKAEFGCIEDAIKESAVRIGASEGSVNRLKLQMAEAEAVFSRLVICSENICEFKSDTSNPHVPDAAEEVYRVFAGHRRLLTQYRVKSPDRDDPVYELVFSFSCTVMSLLEKLFAEYDSLLQEFGEGVEEKKKNLAALTAIKKREGMTAIAEAGGNMLKTMAFARLGICKKDAFDVVVAGLGVIGKINETLEELDELKYARPKKSVARKVIQGIASYNDAVEKIDEISGGFDIPALGKLVAAAPVAAGIKKGINSEEKSAALDVAVSALGTGAKTISFVYNAASGRAVLDIINGIPDLGSKALGLVENVAKYIDKNEKHVKPKAVDKVLHKLGNQIKQYNEEVEQYEIAKERKLLAVKRPQAPPFVVIKGLIDNLRDDIEWRKEESTVEYAKSIL